MEDSWLVSKDILCCACLKYCWNISEILAWGMALASEGETLLGFKKLLLLMDDDDDGMTVA